ncbi:succinoglycan biosynthesis [Halobacteriales archaeon QH_7_65_31]|nr:MAG: succinoglycan biosynthesis [Halobacteriales archaeon QH_7_65_31]
MHDDSTDTTDAPTAALTDRATELTTTDPYAPLTDTEPVLDTLADARIVGLGESTHGTREFHRLRHRLIRGLVERRGLRVVALEANLPETFAVNDYVLRGEGDPVALLDATNFWIYTTESMVALLDWLREFNEGRPIDDRVRFHGIDAQYTHGAVARLDDLLTAVAPELRGELASDLAAADDEGDTTDQHMSAHDPAATDRLLDRLTRAFDARADAWRAETSEQRVTRVGRCLRVIAQVRRRRIARETDGVQASMVVRDEAMADNVAWLLRHEDADRAVLLAHDSHLCRTDNCGARTGPAPALGSYLDERYGDDYHAVGVDFRGGSFRAIGPGLSDDSRLATWSLDEPPRDSITRAFASTGDDLLHLPLTGQGDLRAWLARPRFKRKLGAVYYGPDGPDDPDTDGVDAHNERRELPTAFDSLLFVRETTPTRPAGEDG